MSHRTRSYLFTLLLLTFLTTPAVLLMFRAFTQPNVADRARDWVAELDTAEREQAVAEMGALPHAYRLQLYSTLSPAQKAELWVAQVQRFAGQRQSGLDSTQREALNRLISFLADPSVFERAGRLAASDIQELGHITDLVRRSFSLGDANALLRSVGADRPEDQTREPVANRVAGWISRRLALSADDEWCTCSQQSDWCGVNGPCSSPEGGCGVYGGCQIPGVPCTPGCGTLLLYMCTGKCELLIMMN